VGLLLGELDVRRLTFAAVGVVIVALFSVFVGQLIRRIKTAIDKLREV